MRLVDDSDGFTVNHSAWNTIETCIANATRVSRFQAIFQGFRRAGRCIAFTGINSLEPLSLHLRRPAR